ncbi:MAG: glutamyl-tRNA reductase, partial [Chloroflexota bacterium]
NVAPRVTEIENVFLYNIDDLSRIAEQNRRQREAETGKAEGIITGEVSKIGEWWQNFQVRPLIRALMDRAENIRHAHLERTVKRLPPLNEEERYSLEMMTRAIVAKILKAPIHRLKTDGNGGADSAAYARLVQELFQLKEESAG